MFFVLKTFFSSFKLFQRETRLRWRRIGENDTVPVRRANSTRVLCACTSGRDRRSRRRVRYHARPEAPSVGVRRAGSMRFFFFYFFLLFLYEREKFHFEKIKYLLKIYSAGRTIRPFRKFSSNGRDGFRFSIRSPLHVFPLCCRGRFFFFFPFFLRLSFFRAYSTIPTCRSSFHPNFRPHSPLFSLIVPSTSNNVPIVAKEDLFDRFILL